MKRIQICADDFGFDAPVSLGILDCIDAGRVSATSCMVMSPAWQTWAPALRERQGAANAGLHLDLNEFARYSGRSLTGWICAAYAGAIRAADAHRWVGEQLDAFEAQMYAAPRYVDGHQHVHQLPVLRDALVALLQQRYGRSCAVRSTQARTWRGAKAALIVALGARGLRRLAATAGLPMNADFAGVYGFGPDVNFADVAADALSTLADAGQLMTHPARPGSIEGRADPIRAARLREHAFWLSSEAGDLLASQGVQLGLCTDWR